MIRTNVWLFCIEVIKMSKQIYRQETIRMLMNMNQRIRQQKLQLIYNNLFKLQEWKAAQCIGITISHKPELDTDKIIEQAIKENKIVVVPKSNAREKTMEFKRMYSEADLEPGYANLLEPKETLQTYNKQQIDLLIVPGVVYRHDGYRIGFGGGFYDRFLVDYKGATVSIAFEEQMNDQFTINKYDIPVQMIIKESEVIYIK